MSNPLIVILSMAGVVKFKNPLYNPAAVQEVLSQVANLPHHGTMICEYHNGRVSNVD